MLGSTWESPGLRACGRPSAPPTAPPLLHLDPQFPQPVPCFLSPRSSLTLGWGFRIGLLKQQQQKLRPAGSPTPPCAHPAALGSARKSVGIGWRTAFSHQRSRDVLPQRRASVGLDIKENLALSDPLGGGLQALEGSHHKSTALRKKFRDLGSLSDVTLREKIALFA